MYVHVWPKSYLKRFKLKYIRRGRVHINILMANDLELVLNL